MASAAEQLAANFSFSSFAKAAVLKRRILFTLMMLVIYRLGTYIPAPGVDPEVLAQIFSKHAGGILGIFDTFTGGALGRMSVFALNIMPYISASIIVQLMSAVSPKLEALKKEGPSGQRVLNQYTRYLTVFLATFQAYALAAGLQGLGSTVAAAGLPVGVTMLTTVISLVCGTIFLMWVGEQITARGIGNGISLIIFAGIVANLPSAFVQTLELGRTGALSSWVVISILILAVAVIALIAFMERAQRRIPIHHPKRQVGNKIYGGESTHMPLKLNTAGVIPPIFASALLLLPLTVLNFGGEAAQSTLLGDVAALLGHGTPLYMALYALLIIFFAFFYTAIVFNPMETAENLRKHGAFVPGIRPGRNTAMHLDAVLTRLTGVGALYLTLVCLMPEFLIAEYGIPYYFGGTSLLIVVTVTIDTVTQVQSHLLAHQYEGLIRKTKLKGKGR
jgi:preprotein translocase subunit SecY